MIGPQEPPDSNPFAAPIEGAASPDASRGATNADSWARASVLVGVAAASLWMVRVSTSFVDNDDALQARIVWLKLLVTLVWLPTSRLGACLSFITGWKVGRLQRRWVLGACLSVVPWIVSIVWIVVAFWRGSSS